MKRIGLFCALLLLGHLAGAQKVYFIYLQSDNGAPFYVRMGDKVSSSTASGYVILSNLRDSSYLLQVGFPGNHAESRFQVPVNGEDKGFVLKEVGGGWNLFDLQQLTLLKALAAVGPSDEENRQALAQADPFTRLLVQASDDYSLLTSGPSVAAAPVESLPPAPIPAVPLPEVLPQVAKADTHTADTVAAKAVVEPVAVDITNVAATVPAFDTSAKVAPAIPVGAPYRHSQVTRRSESSTTEGFGLVFIDATGAGSDTIRLLIPNPKNEPAPKPVADIAPVPKREPVAAQPQADTTVVIAAASAAPISKADTVARERSLPVAGATCASVAESKDFLKLRKNMAAAADEPEMVVLARKEFKKRCYSVEQVKLLGTLFLTDLGRFNFFESAWGHLSDQSNFSELGAGLKDHYLADRLFELTRHPAQ